MRHQKHSITVLQKNDCEICNVAISVFTSVCSSLLDGSVTVEILMKLKDKRNEVIALCEAIAAAVKKSSNKELPPPEFYKGTKHYLDLRLNEYEGYVRQKDYLSIICQYLDNLFIKG